MLLGTLSSALVPGVALGYGFAARASITPHIQYVGDSVGVTYTLSVKNTGTVRSLGAVKITRPTPFWTVASCPTAPVGWTKSRSADSCTYKSAAGTADNLAVGHLATFTFVATTAPANANRSGTWAVMVSTGSDFSDPSWIKQAAARAPGLKTKAFSFEVTDVVIADSPATVGAACPATNAQAPAGATGQVAVVCGTNHTNVAQLPKQKYSKLFASFIANHGPFSSASVAAGATNIVLGNWSDVTIASGVDSGKSVTARIGAFSGRRSPLTVFNGYTLDGVAPVANDDPSKSADEDTPLVGSSVLANDTDANNDALTAVQDSAPANADSFTFNSDGTFIYTPSGNFNGTDTFTHHANDGALDSNIATVTITVNAVNDSPIAVNDNVTTDEDTPVYGNVLTNDSDVDADFLTAVQDTGPSNAQSFTLNSDGTFSYTPDTNFHGVDSFTYHAYDGNANSSIVSVAITVNSVNDPPTAVDDGFSMTQGTTATVSAANGLLTDANDVDGDSLTAILVSGPSHANSFNLNADGSFTYQPISGYTGTDSFTWKAYDGTDYSSTVTLTITVNASGGGGGGGGCLIAC